MFPAESDHLDGLPAKAGWLLVLMWLTEEKNDSLSERRGNRMEEGQAERSGARRTTRPERLFAEWVGVWGGFAA